MHAKDNYTYYPLYIIINKIKNQKTNPKTQTQAPFLPSIAFILYLSEKEKKIFYIYDPTCVKKKRRSQICDWRCVAVVSKKKLQGSTLRSGTRSKLQLKKKHEKEDVLLWFIFSFLVFYYVLGHINSGG